MRLDQLMYGLGCTGFVAALIFDRSFLPAALSVMCCAVAAKLGYRDGYVQAGRDRVQRELERRVRSDDLVD